MSTPVFILVLENIQKEFDFQYLFLVMKLIVLNFLDLFKNSMKKENYNQKTYLNFSFKSSARQEKHKNKQTGHSHVENKNTEPVKENKQQIPDK